MNIEYVIKKEDENKKVKDILKSKLYVSSILLRKLRENNLIYINGNNTFTNYLVKEGEILSFTLVENESRFEDKFKLLDMPLDILYEDDYLLIVNKKANMQVHPSITDYENTLSNIVASYLKKQGIYNIHIITRLDHNTTGICIFAKYSYIQELFVRKKEQINLQKWYIAIVNNIVEKNHSIITKNIARKENTIILREVNETGDFAKTEYFVKSRNIAKNYTVLDILLHTGRTHQIRVHLSSINHVLIGDELYAKEFNVPNITKYIQRQALHSSKVIFNHPITNKKIIVKADLPDDMKKLIETT